MIKNDITYEYRVFTNRLVDVESMEVGRCTSKSIKELKSKDKVNGRFFHTSDTDEWFFCWNGELQKLNLKGNSDVNAALAEVEKLIANANSAVDEAKKTASEAKEAAAEAKTAADAASAAVENIENKADKSEVEAVSKAVEAKADKSVVDTLSAKVDAIKVPSLDDYATRDFVGEEIGKIVIPEVPTKVSAFENDANYLTEHQDISGKQDVIEDLADIRANAELAKTALQVVPAEYITEEELDAKGYLTSVNMDGKQDVIEDLETIRSGAALGATALQAVPAEYVTEDELSKKGYLTEHQDISGKQDVIDDLEDIRANSKLAKTALQAIPSEYVTENELNGKGYLTVSDADLKYAPIGSEGVDLSDYATKEFVGEEIEKIKIPAKVSELENDANYLTEHQDITGKQDVIDDLETIRSGAALGTTALQEVPSEYITETELNNRNYLTEQSLNGYATETFVSEEIGKIVIPEIPSMEEFAKKSDLDDYVLKSEIPTIPSLDGYATKTWVGEQGFLTEHQDITGKQDVIADLDDIRSKANSAIQEIPAEYVTDDELTAKGYLTEHQSLDNYYTKEEIDGMIKGINDLIGEATKITNTILA